MVLYLLIARRLGRLRAPRCASRRHTQAAARRRRRHARLHLRAADRDLRSTPSTAARRSSGRPTGLTHDWFGEALHNTGARDALRQLDQGRDRGDRHRARARHARLVRGRPPPLLRPRDDLVPRHPADRAAGHRHRRRPQRHLHPGLRHQPQPVHGHRRPRDLLHRRRLQQRDRAAAADLGQPRRRLRRSRRRHLADLPARDPAEHAAPRSSPARCSPSPSPSTRSSSPRSRSAPATQTLPIWIFSNLFRGQAAADHQRRRGRGRSCSRSSRSTSPTA